VIADSARMPRSSAAADAAAVGGGEEPANRGGEQSPNQMTIEQLAAATQMTVRNIRSHQARGLVSPPEVRLRVGYYGPEHREQLRVIRDLQAAGFNLRGIKRLFSIAAELSERGVPLTVILDALDATRET
jgi:DNA-binding transcriptional MerR regulator